MWCIRMRQGSTSAIASTMLPLRRTRARNRCGGSDVSLRTFGQQIRECDQEIERHLGNLPSRSREAAQAGESALPPRKRKQAAGNTPSFDLAGELVRIAGVDFTRIDGISVLTAQTIISEVGLDMERFKTEGHFASYLGLCPFNAVSGGKVLRRGTRKVVNRAATAFRIAAFTLKNSKSYLGAQYRRFRARLGAPKAITAMAHKLAVLFYRMLRFEQEYVDRGQQFYEEKYRQQQISLLNKKAAQLGFSVVPASNPQVTA